MGCLSAQPSLTGTCSSSNHWPVPSSWEPALASGPAARAQPRGSTEGTSTHLLSTAGCQRCSEVTPKPPGAREATPALGHRGPAAPVPLGGSTPSGSGQYLFLVPDTPAKGLLVLCKLLPISWGTHPPITQGSSSVLSTSHTQPHLTGRQLEPRTHQGLTAVTPEPHQHLGRCCGSDGGWPVSTVLLQQETAVPWQRDKVMQDCALVSPRWVARTEGQAAGGGSCPGLSLGCSPQPTHRDMAAQG